MPVPIVAIPPARSTNHRYPRTLFDTYRIHLSGAREPLLHMILEFGQAPMHYRLTAPEYPKGIAA